MKRKDKIIPEEIEEFEDTEGKSEIEEEAEPTLTAIILDYVQKNKIAVIGAVLIIVIAISVYFYIDSTRAKNSTEASVALSRIVSYYESNNFKAALDGDPQKSIRGEKILGLKYIVDEYKNTEQGKLAALYAGNCYLELGNDSKAIEYFEIALDSHSNMVKISALSGMGVAYENKKMLTKAIENYNASAELATEPNTRSKYQYFAGLLLEKTGKKTEAERIYREIIAENEYSEFAGRAKSGLARLGTIIE